MEEKDMNISRAESLEDFENRIKNIEMLQNSSSVKKESTNENNNSNSNTNELFNLIQTIQSKMDTEKKGTIDSNKKNINDVKLENEKKGTDTQDKMKMLYNLMQNFSSGSSSKENPVESKDSVYSTSEKSNNSSDNTGGFNFDMDTIFKIQKIISSMNKADPRKNLLLSLKPFLRQSRQDKIGEYITMLNISNALGIFDNKGSD